MQIKALHLVQLQYEQTIEQILPFFYDQLSKNQQIRIRQWIKKLSSVINNILWRKNRNLYAKLLYAMLKTKNGLTEPFNKAPPEGSLQKLSIYDISYNLRLFIQNYEKEYKIKQEKKIKEKDSKIKIFEKQLSKEKYEDRKIKDKENINNQNFDYTMKKGYQLSKTSYSQQKLNSKDKTQSMKSSVEKDFNKTIKNVSKQKRQKRQKSLSNTLHRLNRQDIEHQISETNQLFSETLTYFHQNYQKILSKAHKVNLDSTELYKIKQLICQINQFKVVMNRQ